MSDHKSTTVSLGRAAERVAERFLLQHGYRLITRNYHCRRGEIDLIAYHGGTLVFIEVRYRRQGTATAAASVDQHKMRRIVAAAGNYLRRYPIEASCRFDVVCLTRRGDGTLGTPVLLQDAFTLNDLY